MSERTLRRDIERLRELGYAVDATRGVAGGYQLRAGGSIPPLLLDDEEAVAIVIGLRSAASGAVLGMETTAVQALTKILTLTPPRLRRRIEALAAVSDLSPFRGPSIDAGTLTGLAQACRDDEAVRFAYADKTGDSSRRHVEPHRLASLSGRWYLLADLPRRPDDRPGRHPDPVPPAGRPRRRRPGVRPVFGAGELGSVRGADSLGRRRRPGTQAHRRMGNGHSGRRRLLWSIDADSLPWPLVLMASIDSPVRVESPPELVEVAHATAARLAGA